VLGKLAASRDLVVINDEAHHAYRKPAEVKISRKEAELMLVDTGRSLPEGDIVALAAEVKQKIRPMISTQERFDKGCT